MLSLLIGSLSFSQIQSFEPSNHEHDVVNHGQKAIKGTVRGIKRLINWGDDPGISLGRKRVGFRYLKSTDNARENVTSFLVWTLAQSFVKLSGVLSQVVDP